MSAVVCSTNHGFRLIVQPGIDRGVERSIFLTGSYEEGTLWVFSHILRAGDIFYDVGANVGLMSMLAAKHVGDSGAVFSFEPVPDIFSQLEENIALNSFRSVYPMPMALGSMASEHPIFAHPEINRGSSSLLSQVGPPSHMVKVSTLDEHAAKFIQRPIRLVKIDVEGWELEVLRGATATLAGEHKPILCIECSTQHGLEGGSLADMFHLIVSANGYQCFTLKLGKERPSPLIPVRSVAELPRHDNLFCFPPGTELPMPLRAE